MASALARASAIDLLEQAVHTLRAAPLATLVYHWIGSVPFALGLLVFSNDMTGPRESDAACAMESLALAGLLLWMNCWRAVFAGRVERQLGRRPALPWSRRRIWRLVSSQAVCGGTKLLALPLAVSITLPLAWIVDFYRYAAVLAGHEDLDLARLIARARKLAGVEQRQSWVVLLILAILYAVLSLNLAIMMALLPQLVRILTGYESVFSRSGIYFVSNSLFWLAVLALAWIAFDPFIQAVYCVRCFQLESRETGEDLRAALRLSGAGLQPSNSSRNLLVVAVMLLLLCAPCAAQVTPENLDRSIKETLRSPEYGWQTAPSGTGRAANVPRLVAVTDRIVDHAKQALRSVGKAIDRLVDWLRDKFDRPSNTDPAAPPGAALHWSLYLLIAALLGLAALIAWRLRRARTLKLAHIIGATSAPISLQDEHLLADQLPEDRWMALAESCELQEDFRSALRALYLANLAWLGQGDWIGIHPGKTNREYELEVRRRARAFPEACSLFTENVASFERAWYGMHAVSAGDTEIFRQRLLQMKDEMAQAEIAA
ncbi:MAG: DUF4129 domain-containing protein [Bryobacteraceae bacterium]|jgi:hypothetical protein